MEDSSERARAWSQIAAPVVAMVIVTVLSFVFSTRRNVSGRRLPPGPRGLPVLGSLLSVGSLPHQAFKNMSKKYGPLMFMYMGSRPTLVVSSPKMAKEILKTHDQITASRPLQLIPNYFAYKGRDIVFAPHGQEWRQLRKVATLELYTALRLIRFQSLVDSEVKFTMQSILESSTTGNPLSMKSLFYNTSINVVTRVMWNKRHFYYEGNSLPPEAIAFQAIILEYSALMGAVNIGDYIPALTPLSMKLQGFEKRMKSAFNRMDKFLDTVIEEHQKTASIAKERNDFVDVLLGLSRQAGSGEPLPIQSVKAILFDNVIGGSESSATTLEWGLTELLRHPRVTEKLQDELHSVIGPNRLVNKDDIPNLKYLHAVVKETFRLHQPGPLNIAHAATQDCEIAGYYIPGGTQIFINHWVIQRDPDIYERPLEFNPDRFVNSPVDLKGQHYELLPFGSGRRQCPAINLGLFAVTYSLAQLLHAFSFTLPGDQKPEDLDMSESFGLSCPKAIPLIAIAKRRLAAHVIYPTSA